MKNFNIVLNFLFFSLDVTIFEQKGFHLAPDIQNPEVLIQTFLKEHLQVEILPVTFNPSVMG